VDRLIRPTWRCPEVRVLSHAIFTERSSLPRWPGLAAIGEEV